MDTFTQTPIIGVLREPLMGALHGNVSRQAPRRVKWSVNTGNESSVEWGELDPAALMRGLAELGNPMSSGYVGPIRPTCLASAHP